MGEVLEPVVTDLCVIGVDVKSYRCARGAGNGGFIGGEVTTVNLQILAADAMAADAAVFGFFEMAVFDMKGLPVGAEQDARANAVQQKLHVCDLELRQFGKAGKIQHILVAGKRVTLRGGGAK